MSKPRLGAPKRVAVGLLAGSLAMFGVALAPTAGATATVTTQRLAGATRYGTAAAIAGDTTFAAPKSAIVATGENYPDALAASTLAGASAPTPIVLTQTSTYTSDAKAALAALKGKGVTAVTVVGGTSAVTQSVSDAIAADGFTVTRVAGVDRYATAAAIATAANSKSPMSTVAGVKTALVATGLNFPDALAGGPAAYAYKMPLLLVNDTVPQATKDALTSLGIKKVEILGGTAAVSDAVKTQLDAATGGTSARLAGTNRFGTAAAVGDFEISSLAFGATAAVLATGNNFPDALASGPLGGQNQAPIVLTASLPDESKTFLQSHTATIGKLYVAGGTAAIDDATVTAAQTAAQGGTTTTSGVTSRPELTSATIQSTDATIGSVLRYCFDESINAAAAAFGSFHAYATGGGGFADTGSVAAVVSGNNNCVDVKMPATTTAAKAAALTLAAVDAGAVAGSGGIVGCPLASTCDQNPAGSAPLGTAGTTSVTAGQTSVPDLVSVGNFRADPFAVGNELVDFTFDQAAFLPTAAGFHLINTDGVTDTPSSAVQAGAGTTVLTVSYTGGAATINAGNTARGYDVPGAVQSAATGGNPNPLEASPVAGTSSTPDLLSATLNTSATCGASACDQIVYTFDKTVSLNAGGPNFLAIVATGGTVAPVNTFTGAFGAVNSANQSQVAVFFPDGSLATAVGAIANTGAVKQFGGAMSGTNNLADERSMANSGAVTVTPGKTDDPDLIFATVAASKDAFGNVTGATVAYTFDENLVNNVNVLAGNIGKFMAFNADGTGLACTSTLPPSTTAPFRQDTVICTSFNGAALTVTQAKAIVLGTVADAAIFAADNGGGNTEGDMPTIQFGF